MRKVPGLPGRVEKNVGNAVDLRPPERADGARTQGAR
jgi:hypothetical protein